MISPSINQDVLSISFSNFTSDASPLTSSCLLAPSTGGVFYQAGLIVAQYTSGPDLGKLVNYSSTGTQGQNVPVGVIYDNLLSSTENGSSGDVWTTFIVRLQKGALYKEGLLACGNILADVNAFITALNLRIINDYATGKTLIYGL